jgi:hypothetical protein
MALKWEHRAILIANILIVVAISIFSSGFFPYKSLLPGLATFDETNIDTVAPKVFDRVIFMVIDALRSDFVYSKTSGFSFTQRSTISHIMILLRNLLLTEAFRDQQPNPFWSGSTFHGPCQLSNGHDATAQGHDNWLRAVLLGRDIEHRRV